MAKKLKEFSIFGDKKYKRDNVSFSNKEDAIKKAKKLKGKGINVVRDKNSQGHFLWTHESKKSVVKSKPKLKSKAKTKPKESSIFSDASLKRLQSKIGNIPRQPRTESKSKTYKVIMDERKEFDGAEEYYTYRGTVNGKKYKAVRTYGHGAMEYIDKGNLTKAEKEAVFKKMEQFG